MITGVGTSVAIKFQLLKSVLIGSITTEVYKEKIPLTIHPLNR